MKNLIILFAAAGLLLLVGCAKESGTADVDSITVEASIGTMTKVQYENDGTGTKFTAGDKIAVYGWIGNADEVPDTRVVDGVVNTLGTDGKWTPESQMLWKNVRDEHYFLGVFPARAITNFKADEYTLDPSKYTESDLLIARKLDGVKASDGPVKLAFDHAMAKLVVNLKFRSQWETAPAVTAVSATAKKTATVDYLAKALTATGTAEAVALTATSNVAWSGLQVPQEGVRKITVTIDNKEYIFESATDIPLKSGEITVLSLTVGRDRIDLGSMTVTDWEAGTTLPDGEAVIKPSVRHLTFTSSGTSRISLVNKGGNAPKLYYSTDEINWTEWDYSELTFTSSAPLYLCGDNKEGFSFGFDKNSRFREGECDNYSITGDIMSLIDKDAECKVIPNAGCFYYLFDHCTAMIQAPELPATTLANGCYSGMFDRCAGLTEAPELPATTLASSCYWQMFCHCSNLSYVKCLASNIDSYDTHHWLTQVSSSGTFVRASGATWPSGESGIPNGWTVRETVSASRYLTFTSSGTSRISLNNNGGNAPKLYYSYDTTDWTEWDYSELTFTSSAPLYLCGDNKEGFSRNYSNYSSFVANGDKFSISGDIMSLIDKDAECKVIPTRSCFMKLFSNCVLLTQAPELPATTLEDNCYESMFSGCTGLTTAPELPATTLAAYCYESMFSGCTGLKTAPTLPAMTLVRMCYIKMFSGCTGLTEAPNLPAMTLAERCYESMFDSCTGLKAAPKLPATTLAAYCYLSMFADCTGLTEAPKLPATTLADDCYQSMFWGCSSLTAAPDLPATTLTTRCYFSMFSGCSSLTEAPDLPATTLTKQCYDHMFYGCFKLKYVKCLATDISASCCLDEWLKDVAASGTFVKYPGATWPRGVSGIPDYWSVEDAN